ncbi:MAG TPA: tRNA lysidine(34) synthetase TilS [Kofleriaceae bacterium]
MCAALADVGAGLYGVACSGGADSLALADATIRVAGAPHVVVLSIDHQLQAGSGEQAARVAAWAREQGAAAVVRAVSTRRSEAAARDARYAALDALADELGLACVLLGHTARDQAETVFMRILRGTGPAGLAGIPARRGRFVRPLLALDRAVIDEAAAHLPVWSDPMNADHSLLRVRVRDEHLPGLRRENPRLDAALVRLAAAAAEWTEAIDARAAAFAPPIDCAALAREPAAVRKRALARAFGELSAPHLEALDALVCAPEAGERAVDIPGQRVVRRYGQIGGEVGAAAPADPPVPAGHVLRAVQPGDRMRPARLRGRSRKLSDLFIDARVPRSLRASARVIVREADSVIIWAEHIGIGFGERDFATPLAGRML